MKLGQYIFGVCLTVAIAVAAVSEWRTWLLVKTEVVGINTGLVPLKDADWGYLKLRSGQAGLDGLADLEHNGARDDIRQTSAAVQQQWHEAGYTYTASSPHLGETFIQDHETRYSELRLPSDGKALPQNLLPDQHIPDTFWQAQQFHVGCLTPRETAGVTRTCTLRMIDVTGDAAPEIVAEGMALDTKEYAIPTYKAVWFVYAAKAKTWEYAGAYRFCEVPAAQYHAPSVSGSFDLLTVNGRTIDFPGECYQDNTTRTPVTDVARAAAMAPRIKDIPVRWPLGGQIPASLSEAVARKTIVLTDLLHVPYSAADTRPRYAGLPPCFQDHDATGCVAVVTDLDHDGRKDVILIGRTVNRDAKDYRVATLLLDTAGGWRVAANRAICAASEDIDVAKFGVRASKWKPASIGGAPTMPEDDSADGCAFHSMIL